ncbi:MAG: DUF1007 family protein [Candidatus Rokubacteria bacterium]|nr:DUF1007 family protein [Candidatus Rokubacteria bacterium]
MSWGAIAIGLALLIPVPAAGHPHVFVDYSVEVRFGAQGLEAVELLWTFDRMFSSVVVQSFDRNRDGKLSPDELRALAQDQAERLKAVGYFLDVRINGEAVSGISVRDFSAHHGGDQLVYRLIVPLVAPAAGGTLEVAAVDPTIYSWFELAEPAPVRAQAPPSYAVECKAIKADATRIASVQCTYKRR